MSSNLANLQPWTEESSFVDTQAVQSIFSATGDVGTQDLSGTGFAYRHDWVNKRGQHVLRLNWSSVNQRSRVFVAIGEGAAGVRSNRVTLLTKTRTSRFPINSWFV
jgi:hypothetical protein